MIKICLFMRLLHFVSVSARWWHRTEPEYYEWANKWTVSVFWNGIFACAEVFVSAYWVLTVADCMKSQDVQSYSVRGYFGSHKYISSFKTSPRDKSLAMLRLTETVPVQNYLAVPKIGSKRTIKKARSDKTENMLFTWEPEDNIDALALDINKISKCKEAAVKIKKTRVCFKNREMLPENSPMCRASVGLPIISLIYGHWTLIGLTRVAEQVCDYEYRTGIGVAQHRNWMLHLARQRTS